VRVALEQSSFECLLALTIFRPMMCAQKRPSNFQGRTHLIYVNKQFQSLLGVLAFCCRPYELLAESGGGQNIFGYKAKEAVGKNITLIIRIDRQHEESDILRRIRNGERIDHFEKEAKDLRELYAPAQRTPL
jgi:PAS domain-containing protein